MAWNSKKTKPAPSNFGRGRPSSRGRNDETSTQRAQREQTVGFRYTARERPSTVVNPDLEPDGVQFKVGILGRRRER